MILELLKKLRSIFTTSFQGNRAAELHDPVEILKASYRDLCRLAEQINTHAEKAPYPHVAERLRQIASEKRTIADAFREKVFSMGATIEEPQLDPISGKNHWESISRDIGDQKLLETRFLEQAVRLADGAPEISELLNGTVAAQMYHKEILLDLVARADPQANQS